MRYLFVILLALVGTSLPAQTVAPWPGRAFTQVRAYAWPDDRTTDKVILADGSLKPGVLNPAGTLLSAKQVQSLQAAIPGSRRPELPGDMCYYPHNAFVFYGADREVVGFVEVCFSCGGHRIEPEGAAQYIDQRALASLFGKLKLPMGPFKTLAAYKKANPLESEIAK